MKRSAVLAMMLTFLGLFATPVFAHGTREVGPLEFVVGWAEEPAYAGQPNAVQVSIERGGKPVEGAEKSLKVRVSLGDAETDALDMRTVFGSPGEYRADLIPSSPGGYTFHFSGEVGDEEIDQSFTSPKDDFSAVEGTSELAFPKDAPTTTELTDRIVSLEAELEDARSAVVMPRTIAIVAVALAAIAIVLASRKRS